MKITEKTKTKMTKNRSMRGGSGGIKQGQFEVAPIGETGGSSDAASSSINAKLSQLGAAQNENAQYEKNLAAGDGAFDLGAPIKGGKRGKGGGLRKAKVTRKKNRKSKKSKRKRKTRKSKKSRR